MKKMIIVLIALISSIVEACPITLVNDSQESIIVFELVNAKSAYLEPNQQVIVGSKTSHPHMYIATVGYHGQVQPIDYELEMIGCSMSKDPVVVLYSSLQANEVPAFLALSNLKYKKNIRVQGKTVSAAKAKGCSRCKDKHKNQQ